MLYFATWVKYTFYRQILTEQETGLVYLTNVLQN